MRTEKAYLAGGCFWCLEASYKLLPGVISVTSGYSGGELEKPAYEQVTSGLTGHAETVEVEFDTQKTTYQDLLNIFFVVHDPSQKDRQGSDIGNQYRSVIFYADRSQEKAARETVDRLKRAGQFEAILTEIVPLDKFWPAEDYHQNYFENHPEQAYCQAVIKPKLQKVEKMLRD